MATKRKMTTEEYSEAVPGTSKSSKKSSKKRSRSKKGKKTEVETDIKTEIVTGKCETTRWMKKYLKLQEDVGPDETHGERLGGHVTDIIQKLNVVIVKVLSPSNLLFFGSPLFLHCSEVKNCNTEFMFLGYIDDIFGSIGEPMYSVQIKCDVNNISNNNAEAYYFPDNPNTFALTVERIRNKLKNKTKYRLTKKNI
nr:uncharacterized protein LOC117225358 [Megalopta genalis]XP_033334758.1 uncharacterized protein LOC117225358 [Megalopta genalis]